MLWVLQGVGGKMHVLHIVVHATQDQHGATQLYGVEQISVGMRDVEKRGG